MEIVAYKGKKTQPNAYLINVGEIGGKTLGSVVDMERMIRHPPFNLHSILGRGYWEDFEHDDELLKTLMEISEDE